MPSTAAISIKQLHAKTGEWVRRAGKSRTPLPVTDRGRLVAVLAGAHFQAPPRRRTLLPAYAGLLAKGISHDVLADLDAVRGDR
jgi:antitoxin (DNA-binding transcriptional repressor) of toxin-antitoxin stability system